MSTLDSSNIPSSKFWAPDGLEGRGGGGGELSSIRTTLSTFPSAPLRISRVAQLDASLLDNELEGILHAPVKTALEGITMSGRRSWEPEALALLRFSILKMSLWGPTTSTSTTRTRGTSTDASYGSSLQNLRYRNEAKHVGSGLQSTAVDSRLTTVQKVLYTALFVLPPYLHTRLQDRILTTSWSDEPLPRSWASLFDLRRGFIRGERGLEEKIQWKREWKRSLTELLRLGEKLGQIAGLLNFLVFLYNGRYRSLVDRVLKMRLVYAQRSVTPNVSFEYLNRQLVWEAFTEFLLFLMPLINLRRLRLRVSKSVVSRTKRSKTLRAIATSLPPSISTSLGLSSLSSTAMTNEQQQRGARERKGKFHLLPPSTCPICHSLSNAPPTHLPPSISASSLADPTNPSSSLLHNSSSGGGGGGGPVTVSDTSVKIPYEANCGNRCRYCYYCIVGTLVGCEEEVEDGWECLRCANQVTGASQAVDGDDDREGDDPVDPISVRRKGKDSEEEDEVSAEEGDDEE